MTAVPVTRHGPILRATINRPETRNAINFEVMERLEEILTELENDGEIRVFVLEGNGTETWLSGGDLRAFHTIRTAEEAMPMARRMHEILRRLEELPCWTLASVDGAVYGGGWEVMLAFDFRIASEEAVFGFTQGKFCLPPGWGGLTRLVEQVGRSTALRWLAGAEMVEVPEALEQRLIDRSAFPGRLGSKTDAWAERLSHTGRDLTATLKRGSGRQGEERRKRMEAELEPFARHWEDERHHERVARFLEREK